MTNHRLPRFLIIALDKDLLSDLDVYNYKVDKMIRETTCWVVRQVELLIRRKKEEILDKKPGAIYSGDPTVIYVRMFRRVDNFGRTRLQEIFSLRSHFNDALNDAVARADQRMLTITSCNTSEHFDQKGNLSIKGRHVFWQEIDDLLERFDKDKIKLLPRPIVKQKVPLFTSGSGTTSYGSYSTKSNRRYQLSAPTAASKYGNYYHY